MKQNDEEFVRAAIAAAKRSRKNGNFPFGAVLVDDKDNILIELGRGDYPIEVVGPLLEEEAIIAHQGFWE
jgi:hypothetical protein